MGLGVAHPKPLERPVSRSATMRARSTFPNFANAFSRSTALRFHARLPTKMLCSVGRVAPMQTSAVGRNRANAVVWNIVWLWIWKEEGQGTHMGQAGPWVVNARMQTPDLQQG